MFNRDRKLFLFIGLILLVSFVGWYYNYSKQHLHMQIAKSEDTMMKTDSIRFSYKVVVLLQKAYISLEQFTDAQDEDRYYDALDYIAASKGFLNIKYMRNNDIVDDVNPVLDEIYKKVSSYGLNLVKKDLEFIHKDIEFVEDKMHQCEQDIWIEFQESYIGFQTNEYRLDMVYKYIILFTTILLFIFILVFIKQKKLNIKILEHEKELEKLAYYDVLTKIANRKSIEDIMDKYIKRSKRNGTEFYVALIDLDDFKKVNDIHGHNSGDKLLVECVNRLESSVRSIDEMGRFGGDEFIIIFEDITDYYELVGIFERIEESFKQPIKIGNSEHYTSVSIGVANYPKDADNVTDLIKYADIAMYHSKSKGKAQYSFFKSELSSSIQRQFEMEPQIKEALYNGQFELFYQPQIDPILDKVVSAEALIRWNHPQRGFIPPFEFIDIIEKGFMVKEFGEWVIKEASKQQKIWREKGIDVVISVNLSVKHIMSPSFYKDIIVLSKEIEIDIDLENFAFEITEYELISYKNRSVKVLNDLAKEGFKFHLDDFGTGYSSITYLNEVEIESIKIDKSFIDKIGSDKDTHFVDAIVNMAKALDIKIIAEGVETKEQVEYLKELECDIIQGYFYSKPLCVNDFENYLKHTSKK
ncbi:MAG: EAL domain-containing protein [Campylobacterales bacterium]|nr:EAL domain-containing protein [Campylobacterales bacterium]